MLVVKIELWPYGEEAYKKEIGRTYIWNDGKGSNTTGNYGVEVCKEVGQPLHDKSIKKPTMFIKDHNRSLNVWILVQKALNAWFGELNG